MKGSLLNGQKVTTETEGLCLQSVSVFVENYTVVAVKFESLKKQILPKHPDALMEPNMGKVIENGILMANCLVNPMTLDKY